jgi:hypothetical protein
MILKFLLISIILTSCATNYKSSSVISLNGLDQNHSIKNNKHLLSDASQFSFSVWIKPKQLDKEQDIIAISIGENKVPNASRASLRVTKFGGILAFARSTDNPSLIQEAHTKSKESIVQNAWNHICVNFDIERKIIDIYINNKKENLIENSFDFKNLKTPGSPSHSMVIGSEDDGSTNFFNGLVRNVQIKRNSLTKKEINQIFSSQK